ncbi:MAG TPA: 4-(cytidine 5'-diphospho)-2-C-methyl-D-erythritol kinase [Cyclobacteriaceae bacterium]|nr:4-(cytidine 5'-diphospho)-2-C-methyl-D-erythritol kinase [Cyclobacteriaceae bacterium]
MISFPPCKINLGLQVVSKRPDGYHNIETCFYPLPWTDILEIIPSDVFAFSSSGIVVPGKEEDNLCLKAYHLLKKDFNLKPVKIHLHKVIPMGAGLGGGSSNAAYVLRLLNTIFNLQLNNDQLKQYASQLGSDCSFFIEDVPMIGTGRGEVLEKAAIDLKGKHILVVKPEVHVSTVEAYAGVKPSGLSNQIKDVVEKSPLTSWKRTLKNDFEDSVFKKYPLIREAKEKLYQYGAVYASMSGSGSSVFGIFEKPVELKNQFPGMTCWSGEL